MSKLKILFALFAFVFIIPVQSVSIGRIVTSSNSAPAVDPPRTICVFPGPDFALSPSLANVTLAGPSSTATSTVTLTSLHGFSGTLSLTNSTAAARLDLSLSKTSVTISRLTSDTATLTITNSTIVTPGTYIVFVKAANATVNHQVLVNVIVPQPGFSLSPATYLLSVKPGSSNFTTITIMSLNKFANKVNLTAYAYYTGFSASTSKSSVTLTSGGTATFDVTISTNSSTAQGFYSVQVTGSSGSLSNSTYVEVEVLGPGIKIFATPMTVSLGPSSTASSTINVTGIMNFNGTVSLTAYAFSFQPSPPTASFASPTVTLSSTTKSATDLLTITTSSTPYYEYGVIVNATSGKTQSFASVTVIVSGLDMSTNKNAITVDAGGASNTTILTLQSINGFSGNVTLEGECISFGQLYAYVSPGSVMLSNGGTATSTLTVSAPADSTPGDYVLGVIGLNRTYSTFLSEVFNITALKVTIYAPTFKLATTITTVSFLSGSSTTSAITVASLGFTGDVSFTSVITPNTGLTVSCTTVPGATGTSTCTYNSSTAGTYSVQITGTGGSINQVLSIAVIVSSFTISSTPSTVTFTAGAAGTSTITLTAGSGFSGTVSLSVSSSPNLSCTINPTSINLASTSTATLSCNSSTPGTYPVTITGTSGTASQSQTVNVTVNSTSTPPNSSQLPTLLYGLVGLVIAVILVGVTLYARKKKKTTT